MKIIHKYNFKKEGQCLFILLYWPARNLFYEGIIMKLPKPTAVRTARFKGLFSFDIELRQYIN